MYQMFKKEFRTGEDALSEIAQIAPEAKALGAGFSAFEEAVQHSSAGDWPRITIISKPGSRAAVAGAKCIFTVEKSLEAFLATIEAEEIPALIARKLGWREKKTKAII